MLPTKGFFKQKIDQENAKKISEEPDIVVDEAVNNKIEEINMNVGNEYSNEELESADINLAYEAIGKTNTNKKDGTVVKQNSSLKERLAKLKSEIVSKPEPLAEFKPEPIELAVNDVKQLTNTEQSEVIHEEGLSVTNKSTNKAKDLPKEKKEHFVLAKVITDEFGETTIKEILMDFNLNDKVKIGKINLGLEF